LLVAAFSTLFVGHTSSFQENPLPKSRQRVTMLALAVFSVSPAVLAQEPTSPEEVYSPLSAPTNLQVLPKAIPTYNLIQIMKQYKAQLGVKCGYCHAVDPAAHKLDFASDAKAEKKTARIMMKTTDDLNTKYLGNLPTGNDMKVTCGTCHRGHGIPEEYLPLPGQPSKSH
jgi:mono/diheme cytochrome c family protein